MQQRLHPCSHCDKDFPHKYDLIKQLCSHTGGDFINYSHCDKFFKQDGYLLTHMRTLNIMSNKLIQFL